MARSALGGALGGAAVLVLAAASEPAFDVKTQIGPNPVLPPIHQYLFPPMHLAKVVGWKNGEMPTVASGLRVQAMATGLQHPRSIYTLPNGDVLVVESISPGLEPYSRPKNIVMNWVESLVTSAGRKQGEQTGSPLLRDTKGEWQA